MKFSHAAKYFGVIVLATGLAVGCATTPEPKEPEPAVEAGPSADALKAIEAAKAAIAKAKSVGGLWRDTEKMLKKAEEAAKAGDNAKAIKLANQAREQAEMGYNQALLEQAKFMIDEIKGYKNLTADQAAKLKAAEQAVADHDGQRAYDLASALLAELKASMKMYNVETGDSLWKISGKDEIYANPYQWPLIYKANSDKIKDADLIYPGQEFTINPNPSAGEVDAAINHAKTRGAWALGVVEESDKAYLAK